MIGKTLILTGWGHDDYAYAAAMAVLKNPGAEIRGISVRHLAEYLDKWGEGYAVIQILGVGLSGDPEGLGAALKKLRQRDVEVHWFSCLEPEELTDDISENLIIHFREDSGVDAVVAHEFGLPETYFAEFRKKFGSEYKKLLAAAGYYHRVRQNEDAYKKVILHIVKQDPKEKWTPDEKQMCDTFERYGSYELIGRSKLHERMMEEITAIAGTNSRVLILGESGTGKECAAFTIHQKSSRSAEVFLPFNCARGGTLLESTLFGHTKGAFTGALHDEKGLFEDAEGGTLFLDEIGELSLDAQAMLLRALEVGRIRRIGDTKERPVDVRVIAATNRNLAQMVKDGKFREDLYWRLCVLTLRMPPLRERKEDIREIVKTNRLRRGLSNITNEQYDALMEYDFPGNVRELLHLLERAEVLGEEDFRGIIRRHREENAVLLGQTDDPMTATAGPEYPENLDEATRMHVRRVHQKYGGNISRTAKALGISRNTVKSYLE